MQYGMQKAESESLFLMLQSLTNITFTYPGFIDEGSEERLKNPLPELHSLILDEKRIGSFAQTLNSFNNSYYSLRNLWSKDMWRVFDGIQKIWNRFKEDKNYSVQDFTKLLDRTITRLIAFMGLIEESILVDQGLILYFIGLQTEQAILSVAKSRSLLVFNLEEHVQYEILESFLTSYESLNIYRYSYRSYLSIENVINLIILDTEYPKSLTYQLRRIQKDIERLPHSDAVGAVSECSQLINKANMIVRNLNIQMLLELNDSGALRQNLDDVLSELSDILHDMSMAISNTYFNHSYQQTQLVNQNFPL